jgi:galactokinase
MLSVVKTDERRKAREMRAERCPVKEIAATPGRRAIIGEHLGPQFTSTLPTAT